MFAELLVEHCILNSGTRVLCAREVQKSLKESAKKLIEDKIASMGGAAALGFEILLTEIRTPGGGSILFGGLRDHTADSIKSYEGIDICWIEEAQSITKRSMDMLVPTIRKEGSEIWLSYNPRKRTDAVEKLYEDNKHRSIRVHANYSDNPFLPNVLLEEAEASKAVDYDTYAHIWLGAYENMGSKVVIPPAWVDATIGLVQDLGLAVTGGMFSALDVAGGEDGGDENAQAVRHGIELLSVDVWNGMDGELTLRKALRTCEELEVPELMYDPVGVGESVTTAWAGMGRRGERPKSVKRLVPWNGGAAVLNPDQRTDPRNPKSLTNKNTYHNLKAQGAFYLRRRFENAWLARQGRPYDPDMLISIPRDLHGLSQLQDELSQPQHKQSARGLVMVDKSPDGAKSPNRYDAVMMAYMPLGGSYDLSFYS